MLPVKTLYIKEPLKKLYTISIIFSCVLVFVFWQHTQLNHQSVITSRQQTEERIINEPIQPIPLKLELDKNKIYLGEKLFNDPILSRDKTISCVSCHNLQTGGTDRLTVSVGINNAVGNFNALTVYNSGFNFKQFWDGRAETLEEQIDGPINNVQEMDSNWPEIINRLKKRSEYVSLFKKNYQDGIKTQNIKDSLATFVRSLYTPNSRFDQFLRGNLDILTIQEKEGYRRFKAYGCVSCHQGLNVGGNMFQVFGVTENYIDVNSKFTKTVVKHFNITDIQQDKFNFKVPSLRNIALTWPYLHDGSVKTLEEAVNIMAEYQLGRKLTKEDIDLIVSFLKTLTGQYQGKAL